MFFLINVLQSVYGQNLDYFTEGLALERRFEIERALEKYELAIQKNSNHSNALTHASRMLSNIGGRLPNTDLDRKSAYFEKAKGYAEKSISINPNDPDSRLAYVISLGLQSEIATSPHDKVRYAQIIHREATQILQLDSTYAEAYFVLGKWQYELSRLNWIELIACKLFFGGFPEEISMKKALQYFNKANEFKPDFILFLYGLGSAQVALGEDEKAKETLQRAISLPFSDPDDAQRKERCQALLAQVLK